MKVIPGTCLGFRQSHGYRAGSGTFIRDDLIYSCLLGTVANSNNEISVISDIKSLKQLELVIGKVVKINASKAIILLSSGRVEATLLIKDTPAQDSLLELFRLGDLVQGRLLSSLKDDNVYISVLGDDEGVIYAACPECFSQLTGISKEAMFCHYCKNIEKRKVAYSSFKVAINK